MVAKNDMEEKAKKQTTCKYFRNTSGSNCPAEKLGLIYSLVLDIQKALAWLRWSCTPVNQN